MCLKKHIFRLMPVDDYLMERLLILNWKYFTKNNSSYSRTSVFIHHWMALCQGYLLVFKEPKGYFFCKTGLHCCVALNRHFFAGSSPIRTVYSSFTRTAVRESGYIFV